MAHIIDRLHELLFNGLSSPERALAEAHLLECAECACLVKGLASTGAQIEPSAPLPGPPPRLRARLLRAVDELERFEHFAPRVAALIGVSTTDARRALHALSEVGQWPSGPMPGMRALPLTPGPGRAGTHAMLACFAPDAMVPRHHHPGAEIILVFQGALQTDDGRIVSAGEELHSPAGSAHSIPRILGGVDCLCGIFREPRIPGSRDPGAPAEVSR